jgi:hypothetical protein
MFILMILYDFFLLPAQFCYVIVYTRKVESMCQLRTDVYLGKFSVVRIILFRKRCNYKMYVSAANSQTEQA